MTIAEVSKKYDLTQDTIRYYEYDDIEAGKRKDFMEKP